MCTKTELENSRKQRARLKNTKELSRDAKALENTIEQYYTDCRTKEGTEK